MSKKSIIKFIHKRRQTDGKIERLEYYFESSTIFELITIYKEKATIYSSFAEAKRVARNLGKNYKALRL